MTRIALDVDEKKREIIALLEMTKHIVLATCADDRVTARTMCCLNDELIIYCQTDSRFFKVEQIRKNPKVALCINSLQIEGSAKLIGHPTNPENAKISELFKQKHPKSHERYSSNKEQLIIKVNPVLFTQWKYIDEKPCREFLSLKESCAFREYYEVIE